MRPEIHPPPACPKGAPPAKTRTRRSFIDVVLGLGFFGTMTSVVYPVLRYLKPLGPSGAQGPLKLTKVDQATLERDHMLIVRSGTTRILVFEDGQQKLRALDARCTHEGCTVQFVPGESVIWCACHNGKFDLDGRVLSGPPPRPLARFSCVREADGSCVVSTDRQKEEA